MINQIEHIIGLRYRTRRMDQDLLSVVQISKGKYSWIWDPSTLITPDRIQSTQLDMESIEYLKNTGIDRLWTPANPTPILGLIFNKPEAFYRPLDPYYKRLLQGHNIQVDLFDSFASP